MLSTTIEVMQEVTNALVKLNFLGQGQRGQTLDHATSGYSRDSPMHALVDCQSFIWKFCLGGSIARDENSVV